MKQVLNYNIHNILKFQINLNKKFNIFDYLNIEHRFFEVESIDKPDLILNIGHFQPSNEDCYIVNSKYHIKENYFYCKDSNDNTKWEIEIFGFESGNTIINIDINVPGIRGLLPILGAHNLFISPLIDYKLVTNGYSLLHSAGLSKNKKAFLLAGMGGAFKTTLSMDFVRKGGFDFLGDERVIYRDGIVWSYPIGLISFDYRCRNLSTENMKNFTDRINMIRHNLKNYQHIDKLDLNIANKSELCAIFFICKNSERKSISYEKCDLKNAINKMILNNQIEMSHTYMPNLSGVSSSPYFEYMNSYSFIFPNSQVAMHWENMRKNLKETLEKVPIYEIEIPLEYNDKLFTDVNNYITMIVR